MVALTMTCMNCGESFTGHKRKWCSKECRLKESVARAKNRYTLTCQYCGIAYNHSSKTHKYCSMVCANKTNNDIRSARTNPMVHCGSCGIKFKPRVNLYNRYCSRECAFDTLGKISIERTWLRAMAKEASSKIRKEKLVDCDECGVGVIVPYTVNTKHCEPCREIVAKIQLKQSLIKRDYQIKKTEMQWINHISLYSRDGWKCQICGRAVDLVSPTSKPTYATIDHIVPLSKSGKHILSNVQTLCSRCNIKKGNKEQTKELINNILNDYQEIGYV